MADDTTADLTQIAAALAQLQQQIATLAPRKNRVQDLQTAVTALQADIAQIKTALNIQPPQS